jgi:hypothetical protein
MQNGGNTYLCITTVLLNCPGLSAYITLICPAWRSYTLYKAIPRRILGPSICLYTFFYLKSKGKKQSLFYDLVYRKIMSLRYGFISSLCRIVVLYINLVTAIVLKIHILFVVIEKISIIFVVIVGFVEQIRVIVKCKNEEFACSF